VTVNSSRLESNGARARGLMASLALVACLPSAVGCGRWGYGAMPELESSAFAPDETPAQSTVLDAGSRLLGADLDASLAPDGWILAPLVDAVDASIITDAGAPRLASCDALPPLALPPTLDGRLEPGLALQAVEPVHWTGPGSVPAGHSLSFAAAWHADGLYFYLHVVDPDRSPADATAEAWQGDGVEVYVDHDANFADAGGFDDPGTRQLIFTAPPDGAHNGERADAYLPPSGRVAAVGASRWITIPTATGYALELSVSAADLGLSSWTLSASARVGFDLAHNISAPAGEAGVQGNRLGQYFMRAGADGAPFPFQNSRVFCTPTLAP
jgi:hypothetical protein